MNAEKIPIGVIVLAKDEEAGIADTLAHLQDFAQVIVVDSNSSDRTVEISKSMGAEVVNFTWDGAYPKKKQWSLDNAGSRYGWVLLLDADEYPTEELIRELRALTPRLSETTPAYDINLTYRFAGKLLRFGHRVTKRSLLLRTMAAFPEVDDLGAPGIREVEGHYQPQTERRIGTLKGRLVHDDKDPVRTWFDRHNRYSDWEAYLRTAPAARHEIASKRTTKGRVFDAIPFKPALFFLYSYVARGGFLDGRAGLDYATALSMYYWQIGVKTRELERANG